MTSVPIAQPSYLRPRKKATGKPVQIEESCELTKTRGRPILSTMDARGLIIRNRRQELGWNMQRAADECGVDVGTISRLEAGKLPKASLDVWVQVCDGLGLDVNAVAKPAPVLQPV